MAQTNYTLLGHPLGHSLSSFIHEALFRLSGQDASYSLSSIPPEEFPDKVKGLLELDGFNITIPYKVEIMPYLEHIDENAALYQSVNTVKASTNGDGTSVHTGYNTDVFGFHKGIQSLGTSLSAGHVLLIGAGGSANMIATETALVGSRLTIAVRSQSIHKAERLRDRLMNINPTAHVTVSDLSNLTGPYNLMVNATPVGMFPHTNECPVGDETIKACAHIFDLIYNPVETNLLKIGRRHGKAVSGGISMLVWQAVYAHMIWYQAEFSQKEIAAIITAAENKIIAEF